MSDTDLLLREDKPGGIAIVTLNRAPVNALSPALLMEFGALMDQLAADDAVRAVVIRSAFKVFSAGLDLKEAQGFDLAAQRAVVEGLNTGFLRLFACPKPTVAALGGAAIAGGLFFGLASDMRVATPRAQLGLAEVRVGVDFPVGPMEIARATLSPEMLRRLMLSGQPIGAETAARAGIVDTLAEEGELMETALSTAHGLAGHPPRAYAAVKRQIRGDTIARIEAAIAAGANAPEDGWFTDETTAAMRRMIG